MATVARYLPQSAGFPGTGFADLFRDAQGRMSLSFDPAADEAAWWEDVAPQGLTGALTAIVRYYMPSATTGGVAFGVALEAVTAGDALDLDAAESFDAESVGTQNVPGTAGYMGELSITIASTDGLAAGDQFRLRLARRTANAADTAAGSALVLSVELRDAA